MLNERDLDEEDANADQQFIKSIGLILNSNVDIIVISKSFKNVLDSIIQKNVEDELYFRKDDLIICLEKADLMQIKVVQNFEKKKKVLNEKVTKCCFDFINSEKIRAQIKKLEVKHD